MAREATLAEWVDVVHGEVAADFVRPVLGERSAELIRLHVPAKRYLVVVDDSYGRSQNSSVTRSATTRSICAVPTKPPRSPAPMSCRPVDGLRSG